MSNDTELLEVLNENGVGTGMPEKRSIVHQQGLWHRAVIVAIINNKNEVLILPSQEQMETQIVQEIKEYLKRNITGKIRIEDVCHTIGYSKTYLCQLFKAQTSQSIMNYYNVQKIEYAKKLIRESSHNITQISNMLSFDNPQYFSRVFKRISGMTPTEFINSLDIKPIKMQSYVGKI